ncbi:hypothetical protein [uncultured Oscillibacter sp.]|uniref:hypothetical protein n=1 Tax=uncultured Oscillibacter sp. TaxID=876091 RepID=UPI0025E02102|nr:hypothetical protein [uncultured Oscillibacter sp.]
MTQNTETKTAHHPINMWPFAAVFAICAVIQFDALAAIIPNQTAALGTTPVVWGIGAVFISVKMKRENSDHLLYNSFPLSGRDGLILFFVTAGGIAMAAGNYLYAGLKPLFIRELFTGYPLYTIRNIIYFPLEVLLMMQLLVHSQAAGELLTKRSSVPWGAFALFLLWGLPHILWRGFSDGIVSALRAFIYSIPFYASGKNIRTSYIGMIILWFL